MIPLYHSRLMNDLQGGAGRGAWVSLLRLWTLRPAEAAAPIRFAQAPWLILTLLATVMWVGIDCWEAGPGAQFFADNVPLLAWYALGASLLVTLQRAHCQPVPSWPTLLTVLTAWVPLPLAVAALAVPLLATRWLLAVVAIAAVYTIAYFARSLSAVSGTRQRRATAASILFIAAFAVGSAALNVIPAMWMPPDEGSATTRAALSVSEATLFEQAARIDAALDAMPRDPRAKPRAYFLGFAGVGEERVFTNEIGLAARVLGSRYRISERTLSLLNDERDLDTAPLASVWGLRYALQGLAQRMNLDRDVLFLSISSHGAPAPAIVVSNSDLPLEDLDAPALVQALDDAGIKWRVIIISTCYAGGFVEPLKNSSSIVIAAAAPDRTSFGCGSDSDLTYFGEAFYRDSLPNSATLRAAFDAAKAAIAAREQREAVDASEPQAFFGDALEQKLSDWK